MGKGSTPRPFAVDWATFASNWDAVFAQGSVAEDGSKEHEQLDASSIVGPDGVRLGAQPGF